MSETQKCTSWLGHKFEARYSRYLPDGLAAGDYEGTEAGLREYMETIKTVTYECDVCVRCGQVVRPPVEITEVKSTENTA